MKRTTFCGVFILLFLQLPVHSRAQFLKALVSNAKNTISGKSSNGILSVPSGYDSGKPAMDSADLAKIIAQNRSNGPGVSAADSAAAIQAMRTAVGGSGQYYQYLNIHTFQRNKHDSVSKDTITLSIADNHNIRSEVSILGSRIVLIGHGGMPRFSMMLFPETRTYQLNLIDTAVINRSNGITYQVVKIGTETVQGYRCIHSRVTMLSPGSRTSITQDYWSSNDVPGYANLKKLTLSQNFNPAITRALEQAGCDGFIVKMSINSALYSSDMLLIQSGRKDFPASMFQIPVGYTQKRALNPFVR